MSSPLSIQVSKGGKTIHAALPHDAILLDLIVACRDSSEWGADTEASHFDWDKAKFIAKGRILKCGEHDEEPVAHLDGMKVLLQVPTVKDIVDLRDSSAAAKAQEDRLAAQRRAAVPARSTKVSQTDSKYTFMRIEPLPGLRNPERSREFLVKLAADPGIKAAMRKHEFTVGLLTEMDPLSNTQSSHEGTTRLLGLNRNRGEVIELRLRTDDYDGYRNYKTIRNTLCHELAHNVHGPHDRKFWDLCHQIEREVQAADWKHGGRAVGSDDVYEPSPEDDVPDHGGWTGGTYILGTGNASAVDMQGLSRRDIMARAVEERFKRMRRRDDTQHPPEDGDSNENGNGEGSSA